MSKTLITICARGGSKGIPGKNIKPLNGIPLIGYTIHTGLKFSKKYNTHISLSTDNEDIKQIASEFGIITDYNRPKYLAEDDSSKIDVIKDLLLYEESKNKIKYDFILDLDITSPLRNLKDLEAAFSNIKSNSEALNIFSVSHSSRNPYFNMVEEDETGFFTISKKNGDFKSRQQSPEVFDMNASFYIYRRKFFEEDYKTSTTEKSLAYIVPHICFDIDEELDFTIMEYLICNNKLNFEL